MTTIAVLVTESGRDNLPYTPDNECDSIDVVDLTSEPLSADDAVTDTAADVTVHDADVAFAETAGDVVPDYRAFIEELPTLDGHGSLLNPVHDGIPPWWALVDRFKSRSADFDHSFNVVCRLRIAIDLLSTIRPDRVILYTESEYKRALYKRNLTERDPTVVGVSALSRVRALLGAVFAFALGLVRFGLEMAKSVVALLLRRRLASIDNRDERHAVLFSRTNQWGQYEWQKDRYYHRFPEVLTEDYGMSCTFALHLSDRGFWTAVRHLFTGEGPDTATLVHGNVGPRVYFSVLRSYLSATVRLVRFDRMTPDEWLIAGVDAAPVLRLNLWSGLYTIPHALVQYEGLKRAFERHEEAVATTTHFESKIGRMTTAAAKQASVPIVGIQHGPITPGKLQYHVEDAPDGRYTLPDRLAVDGQYAADVLEDGCFPADRIAVTGGVRYEALFESVARHSDQSVRDDDCPVVVFFGLSDFRSMAAIVVPVVEDLDREVLYKPHPSAHDETVSHVRKRLDRDADHVSVVTDDAHDLIARAGLVLSSYSSTAIETLAFGTPLVCVVPRCRLDPTPFDDKVVTKVRSSSELRAEIDSPTRVDGPEVEEFLDDFFGPRDGQATERLAKLCRNLGRE